MGLFVQQIDCMGQKMEDLKNAGDHCMNERLNQIKKTGDRITEKGEWYGRKKRAFAKKI